MMRALALFWCVMSGTVAALADTEVPLAQSGNGAYSVRVLLGDTATAELLVDTGSSYVVLTPATFRALRRMADPTAVRVIRGATASGEIVRTTVYRLPSLTIGAACRLDDVEIVVLPGASRNILGLSALTRLGQFSMRFEPPALTFAHCQRQPPLTASVAADTVSAGAGSPDDSP